MRANLSSPTALRANATVVANAILGLCNGDGTWRAAYPNGPSEVIRHVADLVYVIILCQSRLGGGYGEGYLN